MAFFKIGTTDFSDKVQGFKADYETLLSEDSGRNASGNNVVDIVNRKWKLTVEFCPMSENEMSALFTAIQNYVFNVSFIHPRTKALTTISCYHSTPSPEYLAMLNNSSITYQGMTLSFIEM